MPGACCEVAILVGVPGIEVITMIYNFFDVARRLDRKVRFSTKIMERGKSGRESKKFGCTVLCVKKDTRHRRPTPVT